MFCILFKMQDKDETFPAIFTVDEINEFLPPVTGSEETTGVLYKVTDGHFYFYQFLKLGES